MSTELPKIITIASSDKMTISMFHDFYKSLYSSDIKAIDLNCLYSSEIIASKIMEILDLSQRGRDILIRYKTKVQTKIIDPLVIEKSDLVVKFDIFSTEPEVIKGLNPSSESILSRWKINIEKFNKK
jgi:hypothetical protein